MRNRNEPIYHLQILSDTADIKLLTRDSPTSFADLLDTENMADGEKEMHSSAWIQSDVEIVEVDEQGPHFAHSPTSFVDEEGFDSIASSEQVPLDAVLTSNLSVSSEDISDRTTPVPETGSSHNLCNEEALSDRLGADDLGTLEAGFELVKSSEEEFRPTLDNDVILPDVESGSAQNDPSGAMWECLDESVEEGKYDSLKAAGILLGDRKV